MPSYVSLPPCLLSTCTISALRLCWISGCNASLYRAKLRVLAEVSCPANRKLNACATNKSPSISENQNEVLLQYRSSLYVLVTCKCFLDRPYSYGSESTLCCGFTRVFLHGFYVCLMRLYLLSWSKSIQYNQKRTFDSHHPNHNHRSYHDSRKINICFYNVNFVLVL